MLFFLFLIAILAGCSSSEENTRTEIRGHKKNEDYLVVIPKILAADEMTQIKKSVELILNQASAVYDIDNLNSELSKLIRLPVNQKSAISPTLKQLFATSHKLYQVSGGRFDPTMGAMVDFWKLNLDQNKVPSQEEIKKACENIGWHRIHVEGDLFWKSSNVPSINFGAIYKGFVIDQIVDMLHTIGYDDAFVLWGSTMRGVGFNVNKQPWKVTIKNPRLSTSQDDPRQILQLHNQALSSSGLIEQKKWTVEGKTYTAIINPLTCEPLSFIYHRQVNVLANSAVEADGLATAGMFLSTLEESLKWEKSIQEQMPRASIWFVSNEEDIKS